MSTPHNVFNSLREFKLGDVKRGRYYSLPALEAAGLGKISRLPVSIRIVLESVLRNVDDKKVTERDVRTLANWNAKSPAPEEIPFIVARIVLQDFTGVPLLVDLAAMRSAVARLDNNPEIIEPLVPVDLVVDHSVQVDFFGTPDAMKLNLEMEFKRNRERYQLLKWGQQAFKTFKVVPPGHRHRASGESRISRQRRFVVERRLLSRHTGRHRFAYDDDQWARHRRLGRGRNRSGSRYAWPAGLFPDAGSRRRPPDRHHA